MKQFAGHSPEASSDESMHTMLRLAREVPGRPRLRFRMSIVAGIAAGQESIGNSFERMQEVEADQDLWIEVESVLAKAPSVVEAKDSASMAERIEAIRIMPWVPRAEALGPLGALFSPEEPWGIKLAAVHALRSYDWPEVGRMVAKSGRS